MKKTLLIALCAALPVFAQEEAPTAPQPRHWGAAGEMPQMKNREEMQRKMLEKFDADKDGQLSDAEKEAIKAEMKNRHGKRGERPEGMPKFGNKRGERPEGQMPKFDGKRPEGMPEFNGERPEGMPKFDGKRPEGMPEGEMPKFGNKRGERPQGQMPQKMLEKFDTDKDGQLSDAEKEAMRKARPERKGKGEKRGPKGGNKRGERPQAPQQGADVPATLPL